MSFAIETIGQNIVPGPDLSVLNHGYTSKGVPVWMPGCQMQDADRTLLSVARLTQVIRRAATFGMQNTKTYFSWLALRSCRSSALLRCPGFGILHPASWIRHLHPSIVI